MNLFVGDEYVIVKRLLKYVRRNCILSEDHNLKGVLSGRLPSDPVGTEELARRCGRPWGVRGASKPK